MRVVRLNPPTYVTYSGWGIVTVRGTVTKIEPPTGWFKCLKQTRVWIRIDDGAHQKLCAHLKKRAQDRQVAQDICIGGNLIDQLPKEADRVWVTFLTSYKHETYFLGRPALDFDSLEVINSEKNTHPHELVDDKLPRRQ